MAIKSAIVKISFVGLVATSLLTVANSAFAQEGNKGNAYGHNQIWGEGIDDQAYKMNKAINPYLKQESNDVRTAIYYTTLDGNRVPRSVVVMGWNWTGEIREKLYPGFNDGDPDCWATENGTGVNKQQLKQIQHALEKETGLKLEVALNYITNHFNGHDDTELRIVFNVVQ